jgi:hypothetical protein
MKKLQIVIIIAGLLFSLGANAQNKKAARGQTDFTRLWPGPGTIPSGGMALDGIQR